MPFLAAAIILLWQRFRPSKEGPVKLWRTAACLLPGHAQPPAPRFLNTYGTRLLEPFSHRWFYGDTLFIMDPWIWLMLILGLEMSWRAERLGRNWTRPAHLGARRACSLTSALNAAISLRAVALTRPLVERVGHAADDRSPAKSPLAFWKRKMIWRGEGIGGTGTYDPLQGLNHAWLEPEDHAARPRRPAPCGGREARQARPRLPVLVAHADGLRAGRPRLSHRPALLRVRPPIEFAFPHPARQAAFEFITPPA